MKRFLFSLLCLLWAMSPCASTQRLPSGAMPNHYKLFLDPNLEAEEFSGEETIDVQLSEPVGEIVLNSLNLEITLAEVIANGDKQSAQVEYDKPDEMVRLKIAKAAPAGAASVHLKFSGKLTDGLRGLYLSKTARRKYAVTQFEGTYARMMFPCFDEPGYKATFDLTVTAAKNDTAISNGRIISDTPISDTPVDAPMSETGRHRITFSTSPKMSTYLVALAVGDWQCLERTVDSIPIRVCAVPEKKEYGQFALDVATHSIQFYDQWYGIKYPFGKLDMLAIPDYEWGGMENTASIFYRDTSLLLDEQTASVFTRRAQATVIAHEIAHQWFGDLVTAAWWDDIWLNEGFATWMERKPIAAWHPEWHLEDEGAASAQQVIAVDSLGATRAIHGDPKTPSEIKEMFDGITYEKGAAVLSMLESYVGPEMFRKGVNAYLQAHANGNATASDFWRAEAQTSGQPVDQIMPTFVLQPGVPMLTVKAVCTANREKVEFEQQRFFLSPAQDRTSPELWQIPVCMKTADGLSDQCAVISAKRQAVELKGCPAWLFANRDAKGYYRVEYAPENLKALAAAAEAQLNAPERIALVEDTWAMARAGRAPVVHFLDLVRAMFDERDLTVLDLLASHLEYVEESLVPPAGANKSGASKYRQFLREQFAPLAREVGWNANRGDTDEQKAVRASLLEILGRAGDANAITKARELVQQYLHDSASVEGTLANSAFTVAAANGDPALYEQLVTTLASTSSTDEYNLCLRGLTGFGDPALVARTLDLIDRGKVRQQDYPRVFASLLGNPSARNAAWAYLKAHWDDLAEKVTSFGGRGAVSALGGFCSQDMRDDVKQFFGTHRAPGAERAVQQSLERIDNCVEFKRAQVRSMEQWLTGL